MDGNMTLVDELGSVQLAIQGMHNDVAVVVGTSTPPNTVACDAGV